MKMCLLKNTMIENIILINSLEAKEKELSAAKKSTQSSSKAKSRRSSSSSKSKGE